MKAVILAGGKGTRLRPLTYTKAKPMIPFLNRPVMERIVETLIKQGIDDITVTANYLVEQISEYFGDGSRWGIRINVVSEDEPLGTAGSVRNAMGRLDENFFVIQGDNVSDIDIRKLYATHERTGAKATLALMEVEDVSNFGIAEMQGDEIVRFKEKPSPGETFSRLANTGIYVLNPEVLNMIPPGFYDFSRHLFPRMLSEGKRICGHLSESFWRDIGKPHDYLDASMHFLGGKSLIGEGSEIGNSQISSSVAGKNCMISGASISSSVLFANVSVAGGSKLEGCIIGEGCRIGRNVKIRQGAVLGDNVIVEDGSEIGGSARLGPDITVSGKVDGEILPDRLKSGQAQEE